MFESIVDYKLHWLLRFKDVQTNLQKLENQEINWLLTALVTDRLLRNHLVACHAD